MGDLNKVYPDSLSDSDDLYNLDDEEKAFLKLEIGIQSDEDLKQHLFAAREKAYSVYKYPCIKNFQFARMSLAKLPGYPKLLKLGKERKGAILLDLGCCFGGDVRKAVRDGYPVGNVVASDLHADFWKLGHDMFRTTPESFPVTMIPGDAFDASFLSPLPPFTATSPPTISTPDIHSGEFVAQNSLNPLRGHISAIYCGYLFHLFDEEKQAHLARCLASLMSPEPGSMLLGIHGGRFEKGFWHPTGSQRWMFCHSAESWTELWEGIFGKGNVRVEATVRKATIAGKDVGMYPGNEDAFHVLEWSVTRL